MDLQDLFPLAVTFVALGILLSFGMSVQASVRDTFDGNLNCGTNSSGGSGGSIFYTNCSYEYNSTQSSIQANNNLSTNLPILGTIVIAAIVVGVLVKAFVFK